MALFNFFWLRRLIRKNSNPIPQDAASKWKMRLSLTYLGISWTAFGLVCYMAFVGKGDWAKFYGLKSEEELKLTPAQQWTRTLGIKNATVYRVSGLNVSRYEIHNNFDEDEKKTEEENK